MPTVVWSFAREEVKKGGEKRLQEKSRDGLDSRKIVDVRLRLAP